MGEVRDSLKGTGILEYQLRDSIIPARYFSDEFSSIHYPECKIEASISYPELLIKPDFGYLIPYLSDAIPEKRFSIPQFRKSNLEENSSSDTSRLIQLMEYFLYDREDSIRVSTIKFLDGQKFSLPHKKPIRLRNLFFQGIELTEVYENEIFVSNSFLHSFTCENCEKLRVSNSYYILSTHKFNEVDNRKVEEGKYSSSQNLVFVLPNHMSHHDFPKRNLETYFESLRGSHGDLIIVNSISLYDQLKKYFKKDWEFITKTNWIVVANIPSKSTNLSGKIQVYEAPKNGPSYYQDPEFYYFLQGKNGVCGEFENLCVSNPFLECKEL